MGSIMLNGISYTSGGADVEANPQDTPSDTLSTIGIDGVVYEIEGGGGGSDVVIDPTITSGTKIADITVDGDTSSLYVPEVSLTYAEYMALTEQEKNNGTTYYITDMDAGKVNIFAPVIYSKYEKQVGTWIDDKPLYQKTVPFTADSGYQQLSLGITDIDIIFVLEAYIKTSVEVAVLSSYRSTSPSSEEFIGLLNPPRNTFDYRCGTDLIGGAGYVTVQYTKTTDTAGSGSYNSLGVPMVHYDDTEQVIGTWFGQTLYERSYEFSSDLNWAGDSWTDTSISNSGMAKIIDVKGVSSAGTCFNGCISASRDSGNYVRLLNTRNANIAVRYLTLQYTKST